MNDDSKNELKELMGAQSSDTEVTEAMKELFKDKFDPTTKQHDIDLRTRLDRVEIRAMAIVSFLQSIDVDEAPVMDNGQKPNLATGLDVVTRSIKRHKISLQGKSRQEIVDLFRAKREDEKPQLKWYQQGLS